MRIVSALLLALVLVAPARAADTPRDAMIASAVADIDRLFDDYRLDAHVPGLVYGIVADGRLVHVKAAGVQDLTAKRPVTPDSVFRIASMTKAFTALSVLSLRDAGKLSLDAPAETYVPELKAWRYPTGDSPRIRVRDLLNHTAGLVTDDPWGDRQQVLPEAEFTRMLRAGVPFARSPQTSYDYSNFGFATLGRIVTNVSGEPYADYAERVLLGPLGMASSGYEIADAPADRRTTGYRWENDRWSPEPVMPHGAFGAMGGLHTTANDYAKYVAWLLDAWPARDGADRGPLRRATVRELAQGSNFGALSPRPGRSGAACRQAFTYGMGMRVMADCDVGTALGHGGGYPGYGSYVLLLPEHGIGIFAFANRTYAGPSAPVWDAAMALHKAGALTGRPTPVSESLGSAYRDAGAIYAAGDVAAAGGRLAMNFLMDRSAANWRAELAKLKRQVGDCDTAAPIAATGALSGRFTWRCAHGRIDGTLLLAPTRPAGIQALRLGVAGP